MNRVRTLPILLAPERGEALDSWLEALAHRLNTHLADLLIALGLVDRDNDQIHALARWNVRLRDDELARLAAATGVTPDRFEAMTLSRYDGTALRIDPSTEFVDRRHLWGRARGSRFCPDCLAESGGRWQLAWRLGWSFACLTHHRLLADACPGCGRVQRRLPQPVHVIPGPGYCAGPVPGRSGMAAQRCGADLSRAPTLQLAAGHPALIAQEHLLNVINSGKATFGVYRDHVQPAPAALSDVRALANRMLTRATGEELAAVVPTNLLEAYAKRGPWTTTVGPTAPVNRPGFMAPGHAATAAVAVTAAFTVLGAADIALAGAALRWLVAGSRRRGGSVSATTIHSWGRGTTPTLTAIQLSALDPWLKPSDRLRYRSITPVPRAPVGAVTSKPRARRTPTLLWPEWSIRLALPSCHANHLRPRRIRRPGPPSTVAVLRGSSPTFRTSYALLAGGRWL